MLKKSWLLFVICLVVLHSQAQDQHFSQFFNSPQNINPALSGLFDGDLRIVANHKNQWRTLPVPYRTYAISADGKLPLGLTNDYVCTGIIFTNDKAGDGSYTTNQAGISLAYLKKLNKDSSSFLSLGIQPSLVSKNLNLSKLSFDNQFSDGTYNSAIANGENFNRTKLQFLDFCAGLSFYQKINQHSNATLGFSYAHFLAQNTSFFSDKSAVINPKFVAHASFVFNLSESFDLIPVILFEEQNKAKEIVAGSQARFIFENRSDKTRAFSLGAFMRLKDAFIVNAQLDYNHYRFGLSYDITTSALKNANNRLGGIELSIVYIMKRFIKVNQAKVICPVFL